MQRVEYSKCHLDRAVRKPFSAHDDVLLQRCAFHQHLYDFTPLPEQKLVLHLVGVIRGCILFQEELNKVEVGDVLPVACMIQGRCALWDRYSVDVGAVFKELFRKDELVFMG
jgi:hypothetical protein